MKRKSPIPVSTTHSVRVPMYTDLALQRWMGTKHAKKLTYRNDAILLGLRQLPGFAAIEQEEKEAYAKAINHHKTKVDIFVTDVRQQLEQA